MKTILKAAMSYHLVQYLASLLMSICVTLRRTTSLHMFHHWMKRKFSDKQPCLCPTYMRQQCEFCLFVMDVLKYFVKNLQMKHDLYLLDRRNTHYMSMRGYSMCVKSYSLQWGYLLVPGYPEKLTTLSCSPLKTKQKPPPDLYFKIPGCMRQQVSRCTWAVIT